MEVKKDKKRQRMCYHYHKKWYYIKDYQLLKKDNHFKELSNSKANLMEENNLVAMVIEVVHCIHIGMIIELNMTT